MKVAIVGAGLTGLTLAYELAGRGHAVDLYEARAAPGGELATVEVNGEPVERYYHHLFTHNRCMIELAAELGIDHRLEWHEPVMGLYAGGRLHPFTSPLDLLRFRGLSLPGRARLGLGTLWLQSKRDYRPFEDRTAAEAMSRYVGREAFEEVFVPMLRAKFHDHWDSISMAWMWARLMARARTRTTDKRRERLGYFKGSFQVVVDALARANRERGVGIHLGSPVDAISIGEPNAPALRVGGAPVQADAVVATVGLPIVRRLLPDSRREFKQALAATAYVGACVALMEIGQPLSPFYWTNIGDRDLPFAALIEHTNFVEPERYGGRRLLYVGNYLPPDHEFFQLDDGELIDRFVEPIRRVFPRFQPEDLGECWVSRDPVAQPVIAAGYQRRMPAHRTPIPGFYICNTAQIYPDDRGTNYNVRIAREAAVQIDQDAPRLVQAADP